MFARLVGTAITQLLKLLDRERILNFVDAGLDSLENKHIEGEVDTLKEQSIAGAIQVIRSLLGIEDKKYGSDKE